MKVKPTKAGDVTLELKRTDDVLMAAASPAAAPSALSIKQIVVPIDFSDCSKKALPYALALAKEHRAAVTLVYVVEPAYGAGEYGGIDYAQIEAGMKEGGAKELAQMAVDEVRGPTKIDTVVRVGSPAREIVDTARNLRADLIVIATHGRTGLKHVLLGSVAEHVVQRAPCPVLVVRENEHEILAS